MLWRKALIYRKSIIIVCAITYISLLRESVVTLPPINSIDKYIHILMYLIFSWMLLWETRATKWFQSGNSSNGWQTWKRYIIILGFPAIYGGFIEILQDKYFPPRTGDWQDWLADCIGVLIAGITWIIGQKWYARRMDK